MHIDSFSYKVSLSDSFGIDGMCFLIKKNDAISFFSVLSALTKIFTTGNKGENSNKSIASYAKNISIYNSFLCVFINFRKLFYLTIHLSEYELSELLSNGIETQILEGLVQKSHRLFMMVSIPLKG